MARNYSAAARTQFNATSGTDPVLLLLEITHPDLAAPIRVVNDKQDLVHLGNTFIALSFRAAFPDDLEQGETRARLAVDNVGRDLVQWLETSGGGQGAEVRMMQVRHSAPDVIEWEITMDLTNVQIDVMEVTGDLGFEDLLNQSAVALTYRPDSSPGLY